MTAYGQDALRCAVYLSLHGPTKAATVASDTGVARARRMMYADGEKENLPAIAESYVIPQDATKAEREALRAEFFADNQAVEKLLEEKGFVMTDQAHASAQVSRYFKTHPDA